MLMSKYLPLNLFIRQALIYPLTAPFLPPVAKVEAGHKYAAGRLEGVLAGAELHSGQVVSLVDYDDADLDGTAKDLTAETIEGDKVVKDNHTGLMWQDGFSEPMNWANAITSAHNSTWAGFDDWRLPTIVELMTLPDFGSANYHNAVFTVDFYRHWSSTTDIDNTSVAFYWDEPTGKMISTAKTTEGVVLVKVVRNF